MTPVGTTLRRTLSIHFVLVAILPIVVFGTIAYALLYTHLEQQIIVDNQSLAEDVSSSTEQFLAEVERNLQVVGRMIDSKAVADPSAIDRILEILVEKSGYFQGIYMLDADRHVINLGLNKDTPTQKEDYRHVDYSQHVLFRGHKFLTHTVWSDTFVSLVSGEPSVTIALPLSEGRALLGNVSLSRLSKMLGKFGQNRTDLYAVVDRNGTLVAHSDPVQALQRVNLSDHYSIKRALQGRYETVKEAHLGVDRIESTSKINYTGWVAWVGTDMRQAMAPVDFVRNVLGVGALVSVLFAGGVAIFDARRLMQPLSALSKRAGQVGSGHYEFAFVPSGFAEIDQLADNFAKMIMDIRERENSLVESEQRFRDLVNSIDGVVWEMDVASGRFLFVSQRATSLLGYPVESWLNDPDFWTGRLHPDDVEKVLTHGRRSLALNASHDLEYRLFDRHGETVWVRDLINVIWSGEEPQMLLGVMIDITANKQVEDELALYRVRLEELVDERTRMLEAAQAELLHKERLAVLGQLTATVSHEIRNPLGTVANALFAVRERLSASCAELVERPLALAERNVQRCDEIISELLDFTRRRQPQCQPIAVDSWLEGLLDELSWPVGVACSWQLTSGATVVADPERLRRALVNVISNALQAMEENGRDGGLLTVVTRMVSGRCEIVVSDNGQGIPEALREKIFEPLFSTKNFGVGLGVPIIKNIMEDHGGGVSYESAVGVGTTVTLWLPLPAGIAPQSY